MMLNFEHIPLLMFITTISLVIHTDSNPTGQIRIMPLAAPTNFHLQ